MAYFTDENALDRLQILYFLKKMGAGLTKTQIAAAFDSCKLTGFLETSSILDEMEDNGLLAVVPSKLGQVYVPTPEGEATLSSMENQLPRSVRSILDTYLLENGESLLKLEQYYARMIPHTSGGGVDVILRIAEHERLLFSLVIELPDTNTAKKVCENWENKAQDAYTALLKALL